MAIEVPLVVVIHLAARISDVRPVAKEEGAKFIMHSRDRLLA